LNLGEFFLLTVESEEVELKTLLGDQYKLSKISKQKETYDIFFSYPHRDSDEVNQILKALQAQGLNIRIDQSEIRDYANIHQSIIKGLAHSKVFMAYYSHNYAHSHHSQWELTAAFIAAQREVDPRQRVLIINPEENADHIHPVELRDELFQITPADQQGINNLATSVANHVSAIKGTIGEIRTLILPRWFGKKGTGSNRFVGRLPDMWHIHSSLHSAEVPIITGTTGATVQIHGMGGVGKSLLAEEYALRYAAAFPGGVFWLRGFGNDDVKTAMGPDEREAERIRQIRDIAEAYSIPVKDRSPEEIEAHLTRELGNNDPFLWIVDDIPSGMDVETLERWLAPHPLGKTLITTRTKEYNSLSHLILLNVLAPDEAWELLTSWRKPAGEEEEDAALHLIEDLGYNALALDVTGAALHALEGIQSFDEFRNDLVNPTRDELELAAELKGGLLNGHERSIASTLIRSIERLGPEGLDFLRLASVLAVAPIPASLISTVFSEVDGLDESEGRRRVVLGLDQAENLSLAERVEDETGARSVHTLISRTVRFHDSQPERANQLQTAAFQALTSELSRADDPLVHDELRLAATHARELMSRSDDIQAANLMERVARFDHVRGAYGSAENLLRRECKLRRTILGSEHPNTLTSMNNLAETFRAQGDMEGARKIQEQVLEIRRRVLGAEHPDTLAAMRIYLEEPFNPEVKYSNWTLHVTFDEPEKVQGKLTIKAGDRVVFDEPLGKRNRIHLEHRSETKDETITFITKKGRNVTREITYSEEIMYGGVPFDVHFLEHDCKRGITDGMLNIAIVQLKYHLNKAGSVIIIEDNDVYSAKLTQILDAVKGETDLIVFPEFSIPAHYLPAMKQYSDENSIVIVAGSHYITDETLVEYDGMFHDKFVDHDIRKNISPVIIPFSEKMYHTEKILSTKEERKLFNEKGITHGSLNRIFKLNDEVTFGIMICFDFLNDDLRKRITDACNVILVPQTNPGTKRFHKIGHTEIDNPRGAGNKAYVMASGIFTYGDDENMMGGDSGVIMTLDKDSYKERKDAIIETIEVDRNKVYEQFIQMAQLNMKFNPARDTQMGPVPITYKLIHIFEENEKFKSAEDGKKDDRNPQAFLELLKTINSCDDRHELKQLLADNGELIRKHSPLMHKNTRNLANLKLSEIKEKCTSIVLN